MVKVSQIALIGKQSPTAKQFKLELNEISLLQSNNKRKNFPFPISICLPPGKRESKAMFIPRENEFVPQTTQFTCVLKSSLDSQGRLTVHFYKHELYTESVLLWEASYEINETDKQIQFPLAENLSFKALLSIFEM